MAKGQESTPHLPDADPSIAPVPAGHRGVIEVKNLTKRYKKADVNAFDGISFEVAEGEFFALLGPNGAGKTTTISILTTTLLPTSGKVTIFHAILYGLYPWCPTYRTMPADYRARFKELSEILGLQAEMFKPVKWFSGGMKRKLEIVRSLMHRPKVLFLDEPTAGLDADSRRRLWAYLKEIREGRHQEGPGRGVPAGRPGRPRGPQPGAGQPAHPVTAGAEFKVSLNGKSVHSVLKAIDTPLLRVRTHFPPAGSSR